jgi:hypothetical protein
MKQYLHALALALGLSSAAIPAFAQDSATITQSGTASNALITQFINLGINEASITQGVGTGNDARITQSNLGTTLFTTNAFADISQTGDRNRADMSQASSGRVSARIEQTGDDNYSAADQFNSDRSALTTTQSGNNNRAVVTQVNLVEEGGVFVEQIGNGNLANILQHDGGFLRSDVRQHGDANTATVDQTGTFGEIDALQSGTNNMLRVTQVNGGVMPNAVSVTQNGTAHVADVSQMGNGFTATVNQSGTANTATVNQMN